jgi:hypothetical protein
MLLLPGMESAFASLYIRLTELKYPFHLPLFQSIFRTLKTTASFTFVLKHH